MIYADKIEKKFKEVFNETPLIVRSPGRVNLIGEHTDYNMGFVLPAAIDKSIYFAISPRRDDICYLNSFDLNDTVQMAVSSINHQTKNWANYLLGVVDQIQKLGHNIKGFNCVFGGDIPIGAGLSSSAAIEAGLAFSLNYIFELGIEKLELVKLAQRSENEFVGVNCGIMDQYINIFGSAKKVLKIDCRTLGYEYHPFENEELKIVLCNTMVSHSLASSEYNTRRAQCEEGVKILQQYHSHIKSLRDVEWDIIKLHELEFPPKVWDRCKYVIEENERLLKGCEDLDRDDFVSFGNRMYQSHEGLRDLYEVSCPELDFLVDAASKQNGVLGSRMMGGGFGGCTINLILKNYIADFIGKMTEQYQDQFSKIPQLYVCNIENGTNIISTTSK
ncbi:MAG: galactokinase [Melioribacteraceae bacterium]|nr:galactokinase [Melioribacteraceae bacterium]